MFLMRLMYLVSLKPKDEKFCEIILCGHISTPLHHLGIIAYLRISWLRKCRDLGLKLETNHSLADKKEIGMIRLTRLKTWDIH